MAQGFVPTPIAPLGLAGRLGVLGRKPGFQYRLQQSAIDILMIFVVLQVASVVFAEVDPNRFAFASSANLLVAFQTIPLLGVVAIGVGILMVAGEFDLSVGANYLFSSLMMAQIYEDYHISIWLCALIGLAIGTGIGFANGLITLKLRIPSFITTLGTMGIWEAAALLFHGASSETFDDVPKAFLTLTNGSFGVMAAEMIWFIGIAIAAWALLQRHSAGNHIFASGGSPGAAVSSGVNVFRAKMLAFCLAGGLAALAGILAAANVGDVSPDINSQVPLEAIAACVIGGASLTGGRGTVLGMFLGAVLLYWIQDVLLLLSAPGFYLTAFVGALVIAAAVMYQVLQARRT
ncbi:MAG: ABC transporter permease [Acidimicrobiales bacterium]